MTNKQKQAYSEPEALKDILRRTIYGKKFRLECGHIISMGYYLGNDLVVRNGKELEVICLQCAY